MNGPLDILFDTEPRITSPRTVLRFLVASDAPSLLAIYADAEAMRFRANPPLRTLDDAHDMIAQAHRLRDERRGVRWAIDDRATAALLGTFVLMIHPAHPAHLAHDSQQASQPATRAASQVEIGYSLGKQHWGQGLATEVTSAVLDYCFITLGLDTVVANAREGNIASIKILERLGFTPLPRRDDRTLSFAKTSPAQTRGQA